MKYLGLIFLLSAAQSFAQNSYNCTARGGSRSTLVIESEKQVQWYDHGDRANSTGQYIGKETAPYSDSRNYLKFRLVDFYRTNDSSFILALNTLQGRTIKAVVYIDNDDHAEQVEEYSCISK